MNFQRSSLFLPATEIRPEMLTWFNPQFGGLACFLLLQEKACNFDAFVTRSSCSRLAMQRVELAATAPAVPDGYG